MAIPDYQSLMLPLLKLSADGSVYKFSEAVDLLADKLSLTDEERNELFPTGQQPVFRNRLGWAKSYLKQAGLLNFPKRGFFQITHLSIFWGISSTGEHRFCKAKVVGSNPISST